MRRVIMIGGLILMLIGVMVSTSNLYAQNDEVTFTVYRDAESLTLLFIGSQPIPFHSIRIDVYLPNGDVEEIFLDGYSTFRRLNRDALTPPTCLRLELHDSEMPFPTDCSQLTSQQRRVHDNIGTIDIFWYDDEINEYFDLEFYQGETFIGACAADLSEDEVCEVTFVPAPMPILPTLTPRPTGTLSAVLPVPSAAPATSTLTYPCPATISSAYGTAIQDLRPPNNASASAGNRQIIRANTSILVLAPATTGTTPLYRIADANGIELGWISTVYVNLSTDCPNN